MFVSQNKLNVYNTSSLYNLWESFPSLNMLVFSFIILLSLMFLTQVNFHVQGFLLCFDYFHMYQKRLKLLSSSSLSFVFSPMFPSGFDFLLEQLQINFRFILYILPLICTLKNKKQYLLTFIEEARKPEKASKGYVMDYVTYLV